MRERAISNISKPRKWNKQAEKIQLCRYPISTQPVKKNISPHELSFSDSVSFCLFAFFFPLNFAKNTSCHELIRTDASHLHLICSSDNHPPLGHYRYLSALTNITYYDEFFASLPLAGKLRRRAIRTCLNEVCNIFTIQLGRNRQEQFFENFSNYFFNN